MKNLKFLLVCMVLLSVLLCSCQKAPAPGSQTVPETTASGGSVQPSDSGGSVQSSDTSATGEEKTDPSSEPTAAPDRFLLELKELSLKIELPLAWKDRMEIWKGDAAIALLPSPEDYNVPERTAYIYLDYMDVPTQFGDTFEQASSEKSIQTLLNFSAGDKVTEKSPTTVMGRQALQLTYSKTDSNGKEKIFRGCMIDDDKGRFYFVYYLVEQEGLDGLASFAGEAQKAVESLAPFHADPAVVTFEDKDKGFALDLPGNWIAGKTGENTWTFRPPVHTYDFPYPETKVNIAYYPPGEKGQSFEEVTSPENLKKISTSPTLTSEPGKIGEASAMFLCDEWEYVVDSTHVYVFENRITLIDAGGGGYYFIKFVCEKDNDAYTSFREAVEPIIQTFRMTKP